jgi:hypothetical protein
LNVILPIPSNSPSILLAAFPSRCILPRLDHSTSEQRSFAPPNSGLAVNDGRPSAANAGDRSRRRSRAHTWSPRRSQGEDLVIRCRGKRHVSWTDPSDPCERPAMPPGSRRAQLGESPNSPADSSTPVDFLLMA